jgi:hypothetical protein
MKLEDLFRQFPMFGRETDPDRSPPDSEAPLRARPPKRVIEEAEEAEVMVVMLEEHHVVAPAPATAVVVKRGRERPRKVVSERPVEGPQPPKRGRGRPRKGQEKRANDNGPPAQHESDRSTPEQKPVKAAEQQDGKREENVVESPRKKRAKVAEEKAEVAAVAAVAEEEADNATPEDEPEPIAEEQAPSSQHEQAVDWSTALRLKQLEWDDVGAESDALRLWMALSATGESYCVACCEVCGQEKFDVRKSGDIAVRVTLSHFIPSFLLTRLKAHLRTSHPEFKPREWGPLLPNSLFQKFDTKEGVFVGEVLVRSVLSSAMHFGVSTDIDSVSLQRLESYENQEYLLSAVQVAASHKLLARCSLFRVAVESLCVLRVWYDRNRNVALLNAAEREAASVLCQAFGRELSQSREEK